jgi:uncharacterized membrane protein
VLGGLLAICSATFFAFNNASVRRGGLNGSAIQAMSITVPLGVPLFFLATLLTGHLDQVAAFPHKAIIALSLAGILHFVWGRYCNYRATMAIGTNLVAPIQQVNLVFTLILAIWLLGEHLTLLRIIGIALVLLGASVTLGGGKDKKRPASEAATTAVEAEEPLVEKQQADKPEFKPRYAEGIMFSLLSATGYGLSPILVRVGLEGKGLGVSLAGGFVAYIAATTVMILVLLTPGQLRHALSINREAVKWFSLSGVLVFLSQMFLYMAMSVAPVTVVSPINRTSIIFRLYFSRWINPKHEVFGGRVILGTVVSLSGAFALSMSTDLLQSLIPLPAALAPVLGWQWP